MVHTTIRGVTPSRWFSAGGQSEVRAVSPQCFPTVSHAVSRVITGHLLFRIIPQHGQSLQPRIDSLCGERQISYQIRNRSKANEVVVGVSPCTRNQHEAMPHILPRVIASHLSPHGNSIPFLKNRISTRFTSLTSAPRPRATHRKTSYKRASHPQTLRSDRKTKRRTTSLRIISLASQKFPTGKRTP